MDRRIGREVNREQRLFKIHRHLLVELVVFVSFNGRRPFPPQRLLLVSLLLAHVNGKANEVGMFLDDLSQLPLTGKLLGIPLQRNVNFRAAICLFDRFHAEALAAIRDPRGGLRIFLEATRYHPHLISNHKYRVKTDPKLTDQITGV